MVVFPLVGSLNALACLLENELPVKTASQTPSYISCLDNEANAFLPAVYQGQKILFPRMEKSAVNAYLEAFLQRGPPYPTLLRPSGSIVVPLSTPIYQLKAVYQI